MDNIFVGLAVSVIMVEDFSILNMEVAGSSQSAGTYLPNYTALYYKNPIKPTHFSRISPCVPSTE
jgi:hypothetical protein